ncbi:hypothetical protein CASFOL_007145 [Castilleja foliolosa]|uniref:Pectinesterase inhibitor domain-containing protein n=1 Tax=Castilleja foliolosa TaxID=1961234 RepID=A0ABD3E8Y0_9LAMI
MKLSFTSTLIFLFCFILPTISQANNSTKSQASTSGSSTTNFRNTETHKIVTHELIDEICKDATTIVCIVTLSKYIDKPLTTTLSGVMGLAENQANMTRVKISGLYKKTKDKNMKSMYKTCEKNYANAMSQLHKANKPKVKSVFGHAWEAIREVKDSCHTSLTHHMSITSSDDLDDLAQDNRKFEDLCAIILAICPAL